MPRNTPIHPIFKDMPEFHHIYYRKRKKKPCIDVYMGHGDRTIQRSFYIHDKQDKDEMKTKLRHALVMRNKYYKRLNTAPRGVYIHTPDISNLRPYELFDDNECTNNAGHHRLYYKGQDRNGYHKYRLTFRNLATGYWTSETYDIPDNKEFDNLLGDVLIHRNNNEFRYYEIAQVYNRIQEVELNKCLRLEVDYLESYVEQLIGFDRDIWTMAIKKMAKENL